MFETSSKIEQLNVRKDPVHKPHQYKYIFKLFNLTEDYIIDIENNNKVFTVRKLYIKTLI